MPSNKTNCEIPIQVKEAIGRLLVIVAADPEPARKIQFMSSLISEVRSALLILIRYWKTASVDESMQNLLRAMVMFDADPSELPRVEEMFGRLQSLFVEMEKERVHHNHPEDHPERSTLDKSEREQFDLLKDFYEIQKCRKNWHFANQQYFSNPNAWMTSAAILADVQDIVVDIVNKRNLIVMPKGGFFSIDSIPQYGAYKPIGGEDKNE